MQRPDGITDIIFVDNLGDTPATVNRRNGILFVSKKFWNQLKPEHRLFILLHEMAHVHLQTDNEFKVDEWAFKEYAKRGHSLKESVYALSKVLSGKNPEHYWRVYQQLERAKAYDRKHNGNPIPMAAFSGQEYDTAPEPLYFEPGLISRGVSGKKAWVKDYSQPNWETVLDNTLDFPTLYRARSKYDLFQFNGQKMDKEAIRAAIKEQRKGNRAAHQASMEAIRKAHKANRQMHETFSQNATEIKHEAAAARARVKEWTRLNGALPVPPEVLAGAVEPYRCTRPPVAYEMDSYIRSRTSKTIAQR